MTNNRALSYRGSERRRVERRLKNERRDLIRWEPQKDERRKGHGRRMSDGIRNLR